jgi:hypothetical protein
MFIDELARYVDQSAHIEFVIEYAETIEENGWRVTDSHTTEEGSVLRFSSRIIDDGSGETGKLVVLVEDGNVVSHGASISTQRPDGSLEKIEYFEYDPQNDVMNRTLVSAQSRTTPSGGVSCEVCKTLYEAAESLIQNGIETVSSITVPDITTKANGNLNALPQQVTQNEKVSGATDVHDHIKRRGNVNQSPVTACKSIGPC